MIRIAALGGCVCVCAYASTHMCTHTKYKGKKGRLEDNSSQYLSLVTRASLISLYY